MVQIFNGGVPVVMERAVDPCCSQNTRKKLTLYRFFILFLTFICYTCFHMTRKPISVVKPELLHCNTTDSEGELYCTSFISQMNGTDEDKGKRLEGLLDSAYLFSYAFFMFISGFVAERVDLRYFLSVGMILSSICTMLFGFGKHWGIHDYGYYVFVQIIGGAFQTTGWPGVVTVVANWFGHGKKGFIFGIWNSHTSIGNILGSLLAGSFVETDWALSFIVPGVIMMCVGIALFILLIPKPDLIGLNVSLITPNSRARTPSSLNQLSIQSEVFESTPLLDERLQDESEATDGESSIPSNNEQNDDFNDRSVSPGLNRGISVRSQEFIRDSVIAINEDTQGHSNREGDEQVAITFFGALRIPGVLEFAFCLFFAKLVSYTFLFWLPTLIAEAGVNVSPEDAAYLSTLFDVGGIAGGILAGLVSDMTGKSATTCAVMLVLAIPTLFAYESFGHSCPLNWAVHDKCYRGNIGLLMFLGLLVNGPYALITTAVSAELGTHPSLRGSAMALATVTSIIDGTGSIGAAIGPYLAGAIPNEEDVFYMLMGADIMALLLLSRLVIKDIQKIWEYCKQRRRRHLHHS